MIILLLPTIVPIMVLLLAKWIHLYLLNHKANRKYIDIFQDHSDDIFLTLTISSIALTIIFYVFDINISYPYVMISIVIMSKNAVLFGRKMSIVTVAAIDISLIYVFTHPSPISTLWCLFIMLAEQRKTYPRFPRVGR